MAPARTNTRKTATLRPRASKGASLPKGGRKTRVADVSDSDGPPPNQLQSGSKRKSTPRRSQEGPRQASKKRYGKEVNEGGGIEDDRDPKEAEKTVEDESDGEQELDELNSGEEGEGVSEDKGSSSEDEDGLAFQRAQDSQYGHTDNPTLPPTGNRRAVK